MKLYAVKKNGYVAMYHQRPVLGEDLDRNLVYQRDIHDDEEVIYINETSPLYASFRDLPTLEVAEVEIGIELK